MSGYISGPITEATIDALSKLMEPGDVIIDGGNTHYPDTTRRTQALKGRGLLFIGTGVSGGEEEVAANAATYLRQVYFDTVVFTYHQLSYLIDVFGPDRIVMGTDYPFDMAEYNPIGHIAGVNGMDETTLAQIAGGNAARILGLDL